MKPIYITLENINSFREPQTINFGQLAAGGNIFCISGDTGSGKSTIFKAMLIALYQKFPRTNLEEFINLSADKGSVEFAFEADGKTYVSRRVLPRKGNSTITLRENGEIIAGGTDAYEKLGEIIGLEIDQFTQVALLEQGKFDKFLENSQSERTRTLIKLLSLDRLNGLFTIVNSMQSNIKYRIEKINTNLERWEKEGKTKDKLKECKATVKSLTAEIKELKKEKSELDAKLTAEEAKRKLHEEIVRITKELGAAENVYAESNKTLTSLRETCADPDRQLTELARREQQLEGVKKLKTDLVKDLSQREAELNKSRAEYKKTKEDRDALAKRLTESLAADMENAVALILSHTRPGDRCPVCGGEISVHSDKGGGVSDRADQEKRLAALEERLTRVTADGKRCAKEVDRLKERISAEITPYGDVDAEINTARRKANELNALKSAQKAAESRLDEFKAKCDTLRGELEKKGKDDYNEEQGKALLIRASAVGAKLEDDIKVLSANERAIVDIEAALAEAEGLNKELKALAARQKNLTLLAKLFSGNAFAEFVAEEYIRDFTVSASSILSRLSGGNYTLDYKDKDFWIKDFLNGNKERKVKTLSGGETFLASMSLAISIMQYISAGKSFEFFFLDEGFGTLHEEAVETVVGALRELSKDVTVGIISHVDDLVGRIQSRVHIIHATDEHGSLVSVE